MKLPMISVPHFILLVAGSPISFKNLSYARNKVKFLKMQKYTLGSTSLESYFTAK